MLAVVFNSFFVSLMMLAVFHDSCKPIDFSQYDFSKEEDQKRAIRDFNVFLQNTRGAAFMFQNQLSLSASINVILQMPMQLPVMKRELANKMYSPSAYYLGRFISNMLLQIAYPVIMIFCTFFFLGIDTSYENLGMFLAYGLVSNFVFCGQGFCLGILVPDEDAVKIVNILIVMVLIAVCGTVCSLDTASWFIRGLSYVSPSRYNCEGFSRRILYNLPENPFVTEDVILDK